MTPQAHAKSYLPKGRRPVIRVQRTSYSLRLDPEQKATQQRLSRAAGFPTVAGWLRYRDRQDLLALEASERAREEQEAQDLARERERMAAYQAPDDDEEELLDEEADEEEPDEDDDDQADIGEDDETPDVDDDEGEDLDELGEPQPGDNIIFTPDSRFAAEQPFSYWDESNKALGVYEHPAVEELRQVEALAELAEGLPTSGGWPQVVARCMVLLATLAPAQEVLTLARCHPNADPGARVDFLLSHCRRWLLHKNLRN